MPVFGVDVSEWQDGLPMSRVAAAGLRFAVVRVCDGTYRDRTFVSHAVDAHAHGLAVGAYWFVRHPAEGTTFAEQARVVATQLSSLADARVPGAAGPVPVPGVWLDVETTAHRLNADDVAAAAAALDDEGVGCAGIYTTRSYWRLRRFPTSDPVPGGLWLAQWPGHREIDAGRAGAESDGTGAGAGQKGSAGDFPGYPGDGHSAWRPFRGRGPDLWQFTDRGRVGGFAVDVNAFRGTGAEMRGVVTGASARNGR